MRLEISREPAEAFLKLGDINAAHKLVLLVDVEHQDALAGLVIVLCRIGRADI